MTWKTLGIVPLEINQDWQYLSPPLVYGVGRDVSLFRVAHSWAGNYRPYGKAWMGAWFADQDTLALFDSLPVNPGKNLVYAPVPAAYQQAGFLQRTIAIKPDIRTRIYQESQWTVTIEYWEPDEAAEPYPPNLINLSQVESALDLLNTTVDQITETLNL